MIEVNTRISAEFDLSVSVGGHDPGVFDVVINASAFGLPADDPHPFPVESLHPSAVVSDVIIESMHTPLLRKAHAQGLKIHQGRNVVNVAMPLAAEFYGLDMRHDWNGASVQNEPLF